MDLPGADYEGYASVAEMAAAATIVVEAAPHSERTEDLDPYGVTVYTVEVETVHAGDIAIGDTVDVLSSGGLRGYTPDNDLESGSSYLLFLTDRYDPDYFPLNPVQAIYVVDGDTYTPLDLDNTIAVTADDLAAL